MCLLIPAHSGCPGQNPYSHRTVVCVLHELLIDRFHLCLSPDQCRVQQRGRRWSCPPSHHCDETPSRPIQPAETSCMPELTPLQSRSDSLSAAGSCTPSYRWPSALSSDWSPSGHHYNIQTYSLYCLPSMII